MLEEKTKFPGSKAKLRSYFLENLGRVLTAEELRAVAGISEWARRVRELRDEEGYQILTHHDRSGLKPGQYILESPKPAPAFGRGISKFTRALVLERNGYTCQMCGAAAGELHPYEPSKKTRLHIGHILDKSKGGSDEPANLKAVCSVCNEGAQNFTPMRQDLKHLLVQVRRAKSEDQIEVLKWLAAKFPQHAAGTAQPKAKDR
jgi:hypothetical protein